jgi:hypothetical protein
MDLAALRVTRDGRNIQLGPIEFRLLRFLMQHPNRIFSHEEVIEEIWGAAPTWNLVPWTSTCGACVRPLLTKVSRTSFVPSARLGTH